MKSVLPDRHLFLAACAGDAEAVSSALANGVNARSRHARFRKGRPRSLSMEWGEETPLMAACALGRAGCVRALLAGGEAKARGRRRETALHLALEGGFEACARLLLEAGADPLARDDRGAFPIHWAARGGDVGCLKLMARFGGLSTESGEGLTPLMEAALAGSAGCAKFLIDAGARPHWKSKALGETALMLAAWRGHFDSVRLLAEVSDASIKNKEGMSALMLAASQGKADCVEELLRSGGAGLALDRDRFGMTALAWAASRERWRAVESLLPWSEVETRDDHGKSAADWARAPWSAPPDKPENVAWAQKIELWGQASEPKRTAAPRL